MTPDAPSAASVSCARWPLWNGVSKTCSTAARSDGLPSEVLAAVRPAAAVASRRRTARLAGQPVREPVLAARGRPTTWRTSSARRPQVAGAEEDVGPMWPRWLTMSKRRTWGNPAASLNCRAYRLSRNSAGGACRRDASAVLVRPEDLLEVLSTTGPWVKRLTESKSKLKKTSHIREVQQPAISVERNARESERVDEGEGGCQAVALEAVEHLTGRGPRSDWFCGSSSRTLVGQGSLVLRELRQALSLQRTRSAPGRAR